MSTPTLESFSAIAPKNEPLINLNFYFFSPMENLTELRAELKEICGSLQVLGTILLAPEGINVAISGSRSSIDQFKEYSQLKLGVRAELFKEAIVSRHSFNRMLVRLKKEIITIGNVSVRPDLKTGKRISAAELKKWLDEKRSFVLLDTRNNYEIEVGTFSNAENLDLETSRDFAEKAANNIEKWKDKTVVSFCTGGIRCEKASAHLLELGLKEVYQLDGGILRYFEKNGSAHFEGNCFVFDWRLAVDGELRSTQRSEDPILQHGRHRNTVRPTTK